MKRFVSLLLIAALLALCACQKSTPQTPATGSADNAAAGQAGDPVGEETSDRTGDGTGDGTGNPPASADEMPERPALKIATLDGTVYDLAAKRDRWVVVNFWATWCGPCLKEMPELDAFDAARADVEVIGLAYEEIAPEEMRAFLRERPVRYPIAMIDTYDPPADFPTPRGLPMTYVIAPGGEVAKAFMGPVTRAELEALTAAPPNAAAQSG